MRHNMYIKLIILSIIYLTRSYCSLISAGFVPD